MDFYGSPQIDAIPNMEVVYTLDLIHSRGDVTMLFQAVALGMSVYDLLKILWRQQ